MPSSRGSLDRRARRIRLLLLDLDTMLADGRVLVDPRGRELRALHVRDLQGITLLVRGGVRVAVLMRRRSLAAARPLRQCGANLIVPGGRGKLAAARSFWRRARIDSREVACASSDLLDQALLGSVGMAITSPEGVPALAAHVHWVTKSCAGAGAVREIAERVLRMQGKWANVLGEAMMV